MPNPENIKKHEYKPGQSGNPNGRPRKLVGDVIKELETKGVKGATAEQIRAIFMQFINLPENELKEMVNDKGQPMLNRIVIKAMLGGKGFEVIKDLIERAYGKANQPVEHTGKINISIYPEDADL